MLLNKFFRACATVMLAAMMVGCHSKADLNAIDPAAELDMGVAMPVGWLTLKLGDFLGDGQAPVIFVDEEGVFHLRDTVDIPTKDYHPIDPKTYILENDEPLSFSVKKKIQDDWIIGDGDSVILLDFDMTLGLTGINNNKSEERIDSIQVTEATFNSVIDVSDFGLDWEEIQKVELVLGDQFRRSEKIVEIPVKGMGYKELIPIQVDSFTLDLMDHENGGNVDEVEIQINFYVCPADGHAIEVKDESRFSYDLHVNDIDFVAIWGYFEASNQMRDQQNLDMDSLWENWHNLKKLKVRFMEPVIDLYVAHKIAAPLRMYIDYITAIDSAGTVTRATWDGVDSVSFDLPNSNNPFSKDLNDSVWNSKRFSYEASKGHIDDLFDVRPDYFNYSFHLLVDKNPRGDYPWKLHRVTKDTKVHGYAIIDVPFKFDKASEFEYSFTLEDVDISNFSLDSIAAESEVLDTVKTSDLKIIIEVENSIPFELEGSFVFYDADGNDLGLRFLQDNDSNYLHFDAPDMGRQPGQSYGYVTQPAVNRYFLRADRSDFEKLAQAKKIDMRFAATDNKEACVLDMNSTIKIRIGISAHVDAVLYFGGKDSQETAEQ